jgi:trimeric autotransporter adhesin
MKIVSCISFKKCMIVGMLVVISMLSLNGQVAINTDGSIPNTSSMLDVSSTSSGILIPRMTSVQRDAISSPITGLLIYQSDNTPGFYFYNGSSWVVVGADAININSLSDGLSDGNSLFLGVGSGENDDATTNYNTGTGVYALKEVTSGDYNSAFGTEALQSITTGTYNVGFGRASMYQNITGNYNVALGANAGFSLTGSGNILIGYNAGFNETAINNKLFIHNSHSATPLVYGEFDNTLLRINGTLDINNAYQLPTADGTNGQTLKTNGSGSLSWSNDTGATSINDLTDAATDNNSLFLGVDAGSNDDGTTNFNSGTGVWSLKEVTSGSYNSAFGTIALQQLTTGSQNTAIGTGALNSVTTGSNNIAIGTNTGQNVTGSGNIFIGNEAAKTQTNISNKLFIDNSDTVAPLIYGDFDNNIVKINHNLELGSDSTGSSFKLYEPDTAGIQYSIFKTQPQQNDITYILPSQTGTTDMVLKHGSGDTLIWGDDAGATSINDLSDGKTGTNCVFLGSGAGNYNSAYSNTAIGYRSLYENTSGNDNTSIGRSSLASNTSANSNTAIGAYTLTNNTGNDNTAVGTGSLGNNTTGIDNTSIGSKSMTFNTGGWRNTAIGAFSLDSNSTGAENTSVGRYSLKSNTTASNNTCVGSEALVNNTTGEQNTGMGRWVLKQNKDGSENTAFGAYAGYNTIGDGNVFLGFNSGSNEYGSDKLYIENSGSSSPLIYGEFDIDLLRINGTLDINNAYQLPTVDGNTGQTLKTNGSGILSWSDDNMVVGIDDLSDGNIDSTSIFLGSGAGSNNSGNNNMNLGVGFNAISSITTGYENTAIGFEALKTSNTGYRNLALGVKAMYSTTNGFDNVALGVNAGYYTTGSSNVFIGANAGYNEAGSNKLYIENSNSSTPLIYGEFDNNLVRINGDIEVTGGFTGFAINDLEDGKTGGNSVFLGISSGANDDGSNNNNVAVGDSSLNSNTSGSNNTVIGMEALYSNISGAGNIAIGHQSGYNETGSNNTVIGMEALYSNISGAGNIAIGHQAGYNETGSNKLYIENSTSNTPLIYGEFDNDLLRINGTLDINNAYQLPTSDGSNQQIMKTNGSGVIAWAELNINELTDAKTVGYSVFLGENSGSSDDGNENKNTGVGYYSLSGNVSGDYNIAVGFEAGPASGYTNLNNTGAFGYKTYVTADNYFRMGNSSVISIGGQVGWSTYSDGRFKRNVQQNVPGLDFILKLNPVSYNWDIQKLDRFMGASEGTESREHMLEARKQQEAKVYTGFVAQDVEKAAQEAGYDFSGVETPPNENTPYSIRYSEFVVPLVKAVQEQQEMIDLLKKQNEMLIKRIENLEGK